MIEITPIKTLPVPEGHDLQIGDEVITGDDYIYLILETGEDFICVCRSCDVTTLNNTIH